MTEYFTQLHNEFHRIQGHNPINEHDRFFIQEVIRFHSIAGTINTSFNKTETNIDGRIMSHILIRPLIENYFRILYIYDNDSESECKFNKLLNGFKKEYIKLYNEPELPDKDKMNTPDDSWRILASPLDLKSMLATLRNTDNVRLSFIYFIYRVSSFDTHGNSLEVFFNAAFNTSCNFSCLDIEKVINLISNEYLIIWNKLNSEQAV
jgi:hypothetical protein